MRQLAHLQGCAAQLREDVTRFRYGDEQHLDEALTRIFQFGRQKGIPRRSDSHKAPAPDFVTCYAHRQRPMH